MSSRRDFLGRCLSVMLVRPAGRTSLRVMRTVGLLSLRGAPAFYAPYMLDRLRPGARLDTRRLEGIDWMIEVSLHDKTVGLLPAGLIAPDVGVVLDSVTTTADGRLSILVRED